MELLEKPSKAFITSCSMKAAEKLAKLDRSVHAQHWAGMGYIHKRLLFSQQDNP